MRQTKAELKKEYDRVEHENYLLQQENVELADALQTTKRNLELLHVRNNYLETSKQSLEICNGNLISVNNELERAIEKAHRDVFAFATLVVDLQEKINGTAK